MLLVQTKYTAVRVGKSGVYFDGLYSAVAVPTMVLERDSTLAAAQPFESHTHFAEAEISRQTSENQHKVRTTMSLSFTKQAVRSNTVYQTSC